MLQLVICVQNLIKLVEFIDRSDRRRVLNTPELLFRCKEREVTWNVQSDDCKRSSVTKESVFMYNFLFLGVKFHLFINQNSCIPHCK
jgi:hypothetical protein